MQTTIMTSPRFRILAILASLASTILLPIIILQHYAQKPPPTAQPSFDRIPMGPHYCAVLGLRDFVDDQAAIRKAYRDLARQYHLDKVGNSPEANARFVAMAAMHDVLTDPVAKCWHDVDWFLETHQFGRSLLERANCDRLVREVEAEEEKERRKNEEEMKEAEEKDKKEEEEEAEERFSVAVFTANAFFLVVRAIWRVIPRLFKLPRLS